MDVRSLEYFIAVAEELNFTRAAARCHVVQSALSYQIARLERENGVVLFERTSGSVRLPRAARCAARPGGAGRDRPGPDGTRRTGRRADRSTAYRHDRQCDPGGSGAGGDAAGSTGGTRRWRSASPTPAARRWPTRCARAGWTWPSSACSPIRCPTIWSTSCWWWNRLAVVERSSPLAGKSRVTPAELAGAGGFVEMREQSGVRRQVDAAFDRAGIDRTIAVELSTSEAVLRYVALGFGVALVPRSAVAAHSDVAVVQFTDHHARHPVSLLHRAPAPSAPSARAFLRLLGESASTRSAD